MSGPFKNCRDDWQLPGPSGPRTKKRAKAMRKPPFACKHEWHTPGGKTIQPTYCWKCGIVRGS